jgi:head-tail adaptor
MTELTGTLRERVGVEQRNDARDALAGALGKYRYEGAVWAAVTPLGPADLVVGDALSALPRWNVTVRKREDFSLDTRLTWRGRYLHVRSILCDPRAPVLLQLTCEEAR